MRRHTPKRIPSIRSPSGVGGEHAFAVIAGWQAAAETSTNHPRKACAARRGTHAKAIAPAFPCGLSGPTSVGVEWSKWAAARNSGAAWRMESDPSKPMRGKDVGAVMGAS
jgi:hypothetical protein